MNLRSAFYRFFYNETFTFQTLEQLFAQNKINKLLQLLKQQDAAGRTIGMRLAEDQDPCLKNYLSLLLRMYRRYYQPSSIIDILTMQDKKGFTFAMVLSARARPELMLQFINLLEMLFSEEDSLDRKETPAPLIQNAILSMLSLSAVSGERSQTFAEMIALSQPTFVFIHLIQARLLSPLEALKLGFYKDVIVDWINNIADTFVKKNLLRDALNDKQPLGRYFNTVHEKDKRSLIERNGRLKTQLRMLDNDYENEEGNLTGYRLQ